MRRALVRATEVVAVLALLLQPLGCARLGFSAGDDLHAAAPGDGNRAQDHSISDGGVATDSRLDDAPSDGESSRDLGDPDWRYPDLQYPDGHGPSALTPKWSSTFGVGGTNKAYAVTADSNGNLFVTGEFVGTVDFGGDPLTSAGSSDIFVARFASGGQHIWSQRFGGTGANVGRGIGVDANGFVTVTGDFRDTVDFGDGARVSAGSNDIFVMSLAASGGALRWSKRFGAAGDDQGNGMASQPGGAVTCTGAFSGSMSFGGGQLDSAGDQDVFVASFTSDGTHRWSKHFGGAERDWGQALVVDALGVTSITGSFQGTLDGDAGPLVSAGSYDIFVVSFAPNNKHRWSKRFGSTGLELGWGRDHGDGIAVDVTGALTIVGRFEETVDFGGDPLGSTGWWDNYVARFSPDGDHRWSIRYGSGTNEASGVVAVSAVGEVTTAGFFNGDLYFDGGVQKSGGAWEIYVARFSSLGAYLWSTQLVGSYTDEAFGIAMDGTGAVTIAGSFGTNASDSHALLWHLTP